VDGDEGRFEQDLNLDDGPRLFALDLRAFLDEGDPAAPRADLSLGGLGDPHAFVRARARSSDAWRFSLDGRRDEHPFLGQGGLHAGDTLRRSLGASLDLRLSPLARLGLGGDVLDLEGDVDGTTLENGVLLPVRTSRDRRAAEGWASVDLDGRGWHAKVRQGYRTEEGTEGRDRDRSVPGTPDFLEVDDDSDLAGPVTTALLGGEIAGGRLLLEARASRADLDRDLDYSERRAGDLGGPYTRTTRADGDRRRIVDSGAVEAAWALGDRWAVETSAERRALREDGDSRTVTTTTDAGGTTVTTDLRDEGVRQRVLEERVGLRFLAARDFTLRAGSEWIQDRLDANDGSLEGSVRTRGVFAEARGPITDRIRVRADLSTARGSDVFTPLTPKDRRRIRVGADWRHPDGRRLGAEFRDTELENRDGLGSRGREVRFSGGLGKEDGFTVDAGATFRSLDLETETLATRASAPVRGRTESDLRTGGADLLLSWPLVPALRLTAGGNFVRDGGSLPVRAYDASVGLRWQVTKALGARLEARRREYDEIGADALDYEADILEVALEMRF
jgi:hypothetical protein